MVGRMWMSLRYSDPLDNSSNFDKIHAEIAKINPPTASRPYIFLSMSYPPLGKRPNLGECVKLTPHGG